MSDVPLKEHLESRIEALEKASEKAERTLEKRLEGMNEFREQLRMQSATFATREWIDAKFDSLKSGNKDVIALVLSLLGITIAAVSLIIRIK